MLLSEREVYVTSNILIIEGASWNRFWDRCSVSIFWGFLSSLGVVRDHTERRDP